MATKTKQSSAKTSRKPNHNVQRSSLEAPVVSAGLSKDNLVTCVTLPERQEQLRALFGQTNKSPFLWGLSPLPKFKASIAIINKWHAAIGQGQHEKKIRELNDSFIAKAGDSESTNHAALLATIALAVYSPQTTLSLGDDPIKTDALEGSVFTQLATVEHRLWLQMADRNVTAHDVLPQRRIMESLVANLLDNDGWPLAAEVRNLELLAASWIRCSKIFGLLGSRMNAQTQSQLEWMCRQWIRLLRSDGSLMFCEPGGGLNSTAFGTALLEAARDPVCNRLATQCFPKSKTGSKMISKGVPTTSGLSEWAEVGVLQKRWRRQSPKIGFTFHRRQIGLEILKKSPLIQGDCTPKLSVNGSPIALSEDFGVSCHLRYDHADYVELESKFNTFVLQRQLLYLRHDDLLLICDNVSGPDVGELQYSCFFPTGPSFEAITETENTEIYLRQKKKHFLCIPLALPEWKTAPTLNTFKVKQGGLSLYQQQKGRGLSAPMVIDLNPKRSIKPRTWRRLTVAENMETVGHDIAAAYRLQIGRQQWLFYRTIVEKGNRTFLGQNFADDFFVARIDVGGRVESLLEVE